jgi:hypothetical protein
MDSLSITATCIGLVATIVKTSVTVTGIVRDVREARSDLNGISRELLSLKTVLELVVDKVSSSGHESLPETLEKQIVGIATNCGGVVTEIEETLKKYEGTRVTKAAKWVAMRKGDMAKLRLSLEAHKSALEIALDFLNLYVTLSTGAVCNL